MPKSKKKQLQGQHAACGPCAAQACSAVSQYYLEKRKTEKCFDKMENKAVNIGYESIRRFREEVTPQTKHSHGKTQTNEDRRLLVKRKLSNNRRWWGAMEGCPTAKTFEVGGVEGWGREIFFRKEEGRITAIATSKILPFLNCTKTKVKYFYCFPHRKVSIAINCIFITILSPKILSRSRKIFFHR